MKTRDVTRSIALFPRRLLFILIYFLTLKWLTDIIRLIMERCKVKRRGDHLRDVRRGRPLRCSPRCAIVRPEVYKRADPLIYSQTYLMEQGLAVTWNNPDIQLYENGVPVSSSSLKPDTEYDVVATVFNNSTDAPAAGLPVEFHFRSFGVGATTTPIATTTIDLPVKGSPQHPANAKVVWRTPTTPGHYCLKVKLVWPDDANPKNNLGQENTNVVTAASPAVFGIPVRNEDTIRKRVRMTVDTYVIPARMLCSEKPKKKHSDRRHRMHKRLDVFIPPTEEAADWTLARVQHGEGGFPVPNGWTVDIEPTEFELDAGATRDVKVSINPPDDFRGDKAFNINARHGAGLLGGVTVTVTRK